MTFIKYCLALAILLNSTNIFSQIFGNTDAPDYGSYGQNQAVWLKIITGPTDSGVFTHYGIYDHPTTGGTCAIKFSIYDDHPTSDRPNNILVDDYLESPTNGVWNEHPVGPNLTISPNTTYWIGLRFNCNYGSGRVAGENWANQPLKYYDSWSFLSNWPDPVNNPSTYGSVNNVSLYLVGNNQTLPAEILSFNVDKDNVGTKIKWEVSSEINNAGWTIQRSDNGYSWSDVAWVDGQGNSSSLTSYSFIDNYEKYGLTFYRLEQADYDGTKSYSKVEKVEYINRVVSIYPNPVDNNLFFKGVNGISEYQLFDADGKLLTTGNTSSHKGINIEQLNSGIYFVTIQKETHRFVKQ